MLVFVRLLLLSLILNVKRVTYGKTLHYKALGCKFASTLCALATCSSAGTLCQSRFLFLKVFSLQDVCHKVVYISSSFLNKRHKSQDIGRFLSRFSAH